VQALMLALMLVLALMPCLKRAPELKITAYHIFTS
jgi:hypothetical protein